jgi:hypothetical protein
LILHFEGFAGHPKLSVDAFINGVGHTCHIAKGLMRGNICGESTADRALCCFHTQGKASKPHRMKYAKANTSGQGVDHCFAIHLKPQMSRLLYC